MALGGSIGAVHKRTVNNGVADRPYRETMDYFPTGRYLWRNPVWVNLLGDPTLRAFPLAPARALQANGTKDQVRLSWQASPDEDVLGYRVYRAPPGSASFAVLPQAQMITQTHFTDPAPEAGAHYMVRAYGLKTVAAGSFYTLSQGIYATPDRQGAHAPPPPITLETPVNQPVALPAIFNTSSPERIHALIEGPARGRLVQDVSGWRYLPAAGVTGPVDIRYSVSTRRETSEARLRILVGN
jgi:hypothetical protein